MERVFAGIFQDLSQREVVWQRRQPDGGDGSIVGAQARDDLLYQGAASAGVSQHRRPRIVLVHSDAVVDGQLVDPGTG